MTTCPDCGRERCPTFGGYTAPVEHAACLTLAIARVRAERDKLRAKADDYDALRDHYMRGATDRERAVTEQRDAALAREAGLRAAKDGAYRERNQCVIALARIAQRLGWRTGTMPHVGADWDDDWRTLLFIDLPSGQVTWHFHDSEKPLLAGMSHFPHETWDGHDTPEKYRRLAALLAAAERAGGVK